MKKTKKLMILGLSAATAAVAATGAVSSFAWFATNDTVTATGMKVKIQSASTLLIDTAETTASNGRLANGASTKAALAASASGPEAGIKPASTVDGTNWFTADAAEADASTAKTKGYKAVEGDDNLKNYRLANTFYLQTWDVTQESTTSTNKKLVIDSITVDYTTGDNLNKSFRVLTVVDTTKVFCGPTSTDTPTNVGVSAVTDGVATTSALSFATVGSLASGVATLTAGNTLVSDVLYNKVYAANVYLYFDGEDASNYTDNIPDAEHLKDYTVSLSFSLVAAA